RLKDPPTQKRTLQKVDVLAGHFVYGMHRNLPPDVKYRYVTVLRQPLATYVSSVQYLLRTKLKTIQQAVSAEEAGM
ncbi:unnamed protein product, partial [Phaeothamnion confervicola]